MFAVALSQSAGLLVVHICAFFRNFEERLCNQSYLQSRLDFELVENFADMGLNGSLGNVHLLCYVPVRKAGAEK